MFHFMAKDRVGVFGHAGRITPRLAHFPGKERPFLNYRQPGGSAYAFFTSRGSPVPEASLICEPVQADSRSRWFSGMASKP